MKTLGSQSWGADKNTLLKIYKTLILAKIDYSCIAYATASKTTLKLLDAVHHTAIRIATGAFKSSPSISILNKSGEPTLQERREKLTMMYVTNLAAKPNHGTYGHIFTNSNNQNILTVKNKTDLHQYINTTLHTHNILVPIIQPITLHKKPPWLFDETKINTDLSKYKKNDKTLQFKISEIQSQLREYQVYYTDASKTKNGCGIAIVHNNETKTYQLSTTCSVFEAEAVAVLKALEIASHTNYTHIAVCTDSLSALQALNNSYARETVIQNIQDQTHQMTREQSKTVQLIWVPAHTGIEGNEDANTAARESMNHEDQETITLLPNKTYIKTTVKTKFHTTRLTKWRNTTNNKLRTVKDDILNWNSGTTRREQVIMTRLRIGHTRHTHEHLMARLDAKLCEACNKQLTVNHILTDCELYTNLRTYYNLPQDLKDTLRLDSTMTNSVIKFLDATNIRNI